MPLFSTELSEKSRYLREDPIHRFQGDRDFVDSEASKPIKAKDSQEF